MRPRSLRDGLLLGLGTALLVSLVPAGWWLDHSFSRELEARAREDLALAPMRLADRDASRGDALMMHAQEVAALPGLGAALAGDDRSRALRVLVEGGTPPGEAPVLVAAGGEAWMGPFPGAALLEATRAGKAPVGFVLDGDALYALSVAPVTDDGRTVGAAGVAVPMDQSSAATLAGLTAADVVLAAPSGRVLATTLDDSVAAAALAGVGAPGAAPADDEVRDVRAGGRRWWVVTAPLGGVARAVFAVDVAQELAVLPRLRRGAVAAGALGVGMVLLLGGLVAAGVARPVGSLARAADRLAEGDFDAPLPRSRLLEVARVTRAFQRMRSALASRLEELSRANAELAQREARLRALQAEMIQRDRLAAAGRLVAELAHEIRNPVANVRNCLEVVRRRAAGDPELVQFADLAIDELLRMHELAEQMLDLNRPLDPGAARCDPGDVVARVAELLRAGAQGERWPTTVEGGAHRTVAMAPDVLKQVLLSLVENARESMPGGGRVTIRLTEEPGTVTVEVLDEGAGIAEGVLPRVFDPFFTTKDGVRGTGLGLFIAEGLVRRAGGRLLAGNREDGPGARFTMELPSAQAREGAGAPGAGAGAR